MILHTVSEIYHVNTMIKSNDFHVYLFRRIYCVRSQYISREKYILTFNPN